MEIQNCIAVEQFTEEIKGISILGKVVKILGKVVTVKIVYSVF